MTVLGGVKLAFIGGGMMATAMIRGVLQRDLVRPNQVFVGDPDEARGSYLTETFGVHYTANNVEAVNAADVVVLAVKPQYFDAVAADVYGRLSDVMFVLSIMAGVSIETIDARLACARVVRAMPNTPGAIGEGMTAWMATDAVDAHARNQAQQILSALGETLQVKKESYLDIATAVSGSGPAYVFLFMEAMMDAAVHMGFSRTEAEQLVLATVRGSVAFAQTTDEHITILRNQVTSPGGTTAEALYHMEKSGFRQAVARGMWGAFHRSVELGGGDPRNPDMER